MTDNIYQIIAKIGKEAGALAPENKGGVPFAFRGVDQVIAHLVPHLRAHGVITVPEVLEHKVTTRELNNNKAITQSEVLTKFTFYAPDGTSVSAVTAGLAQDYADRSAAQAQSVAFRVALLQTFTLPTHDKEPEVAGEETQKFIAEHGKSAPAPLKVDSLKALQDNLRQASQSVKGGINGSAYLSKLVEANQDLFANGAGEPLTFAQVWQDEGKLTVLGGLFTAQNG